MNNLKITNSDNKITQPKLEVLRFDSVDVIATSVMLLADENELIANLTSTNYFYAPNPINSGSSVGGGYVEPTSGQ